MTDTTKEIFEKYQVRKNKKQKEEFREYVTKIATENGYECKIEKGGCGVNNIVVGDVDSAKVIYTAHYDTQPILPIPNINMPKHMVLTTLLQLFFLALLLVPMFLVLGLLCFALEKWGVPVEIVDIVYLVLDYGILVWLLLFAYVGKANPHTANDNTSGVTTLIDIMTSLPKKDRQGVAFVFFDLEELGLIGSSSFASKHKDIKNNTLIVNFDCVSDGKKMMFVVKKGAKKYIEALEKSFQSNDVFEVEIATKGVFYPSDQLNFKCGVGVAALLKTKNGKIEYLNKVHSKKDTIYQEENIKYLVNGAKKLAKELNKVEK